jgi:FkbM family methyltransferase
MHTTHYRQFEISYQDDLELATLIEEIFKKNTYYVDLDAAAPRIIDAGAHIGLTTLYLHSLYPRGTFICIEPNPNNLPLLKRNLEANGVENVTIIPKALVGKTPHKELFVHPNWGVFSSFHSGGWTGKEAGTTVPVETMQLSELLKEPADILKIDIEGVEMEVLEGAEPLLSNVGHLILEFHQTKSNQLEPMLVLLRHHFPIVDVVKDDRKETDPRQQLYLIEARQKQGREERLD